MIQQTINAALFGTRSVTPTLIEHSAQHPIQSQIQNSNIAYPTSTCPPQVEHISTTSNGPTGNPHT